MDRVPTLDGKRLSRRKEAKLAQPCDGSLVDLPAEVICRMLSFLDARSLLESRRLNQQFRALASKDSAGWKNLCRKLWQTKIHVSRQARDHPGGAMAAYRASVVDARTRRHITLDEFVYDPVLRTGTVWSFRFKEGAGTDWTSWDPWWNGEAARQMVFLRDGSVKFYADADSPEDLKDPVFPRRGNLAEPPVPMTWRFLPAGPRGRPIDFPSRELGSYVRFSVGGRDVPTYVMRRSPTKNWGFVMESCWGLYASFSLPLRPTTQRRTRTRLLRRAHDANGNWHNVEVFADDSDSGGEDEIEGAAGIDRLLTDDENLVVTSELQRREAFLYNFGGRLPVGEEEIAEFERNGNVLDT